MTSKNFSNDEDNFLSPNNLCGEKLMKLVCRGSALLTEMMELSQHIPPVFHQAAKEGILDQSKQKLVSSLSTKVFGLFGGRNIDTEDEVLESAYPFSFQEDSDDKRYAPLLFDFSYLNAAEEHEGRICDIPDNVELEASFTASHKNILAKFYNLFESFYHYQNDLNKFATDLDAGYYIQYSIDSVLLDEQGRQLLCEAVYHYGLLLLLFDRYIPGPIRERLIIAFFRYCGKDGTLTNIDEVCKLCKSTGWIFSPSMKKMKKPSKYADKLFARFPLPAELVKNVIGRLLTDDLYMQSTAFPKFDHRSTRLSKQASMLYVVLFFQPNVLHDEMGTMREIVDKFFSDNWVISIYMGIIIDLSEEWRDFKAAQTALNNVLTIQNVKKFHESNASVIALCSTKLDKYLTRQLITDQYVLDHTRELVNFSRQCNVAIRWRMLHRRVQNRRFSYIINHFMNPSLVEQKTFLSSDVNVPDSDVVSLFLKSSQFDMKLKESFARLLETKSKKWSECRQMAEQRMTELSEYFSGEQALTRVSRDEELTKWFAGMADEIKQLSYGEEHSTVTGQKIQRYIQTLDDIQEYDIIDRNIACCEFLKETKDLLLKMVKAVCIKEDMIVIVESIADMSFAWEVIHEYTPAIRECVKEDPSTAVSLRALFLKLSKARDVPIFRMEQCIFPQLKKTFDFFTVAIITFTKEILEIIPQSLFGILLKIVDIMEEVLQLPVKIQVDSIKDFALLDERYKLAELTHQASFYTEGILIMENIPLRIEPRQLLEDSLRRQIIRQVSILLHIGLSFNVPVDSMMETLVKFRNSNMRSISMVANRIDSFRRGVEYIQDYIGILGLKIWGEEFSNIIRCCTKRESSRYLEASQATNAVINEPVHFKIPMFHPTRNDPHCASFMGRTLTALLRMTDSQATIYSRVCNGWFLADGTPMCGPHTITVLKKAIGIPGLSGLDHLLSLRISFELKRFFKFYGTTVKESAVLIEQVREKLFPEWKTPADDAFYASAVKKMEKVLTPTGTCLRRIGQAQLLRKMIRSTVQLNARVNVNVLFQSISSLNSSLLTDMHESYNNTKENYSSPSHCHISKEDLSLLDICNEGDPVQSIFAKTDPLEGLPVVLLLFVVSFMPKFSYDSDFGSLVRSEMDFAFDGWPIVTGLATLLKQFHQSYAKSLIAYLAQFVRAKIDNFLEVEKGEDEVIAPFPPVLKNTLIFMSQLCSIGNVPLSILHSYIPQYMFDLCGE